MTVREFIVVAGVVVLVASSQAWTQSQEAGVGVRLRIIMRNGNAVEIKNAKPLSGLSLAIHEYGIIKIPWDKVSRLVIGEYDLDKGWYPVELTASDGKQEKMKMMRTDWIILGESDLGRMKISFQDIAEFSVMSSAPSLPASVQSTVIAPTGDKRTENDQRERANLLLKRIGSMPAPVVGSFQEALKAVSDEDVKALDVFLFLSKQDALFPKEQFLTSRVEQLKARLTLVSKDDITQWQSALNATSGDILTRAQTVVYMVQIDRLFPQERFNSKESTAILSRLKTISADAISEWQKKNGGERSQAAIAICTTDLQ